MPWRELMPEHLPMRRTVKAMNVMPYLTSLSFPLLIALVLASLCPAHAGYGGQGPTDEEAEWVRKHVGMYIWGPGREKELTSWDRDDLGRMVARLGAKVVRSTFGMYREPWRPEYDPLLSTFLDGFRSPEWRTLIDRYDTIVLTLADGSGRQFEPVWTKKHYRRLTEYLLSHYADADKIFILGLWEGDHWLTEKDMAESPETVEKYTRYFEARHEGVREGRASVPGSRSRVYEMIELVTLDYEGQKYLINRIIPRTRADLYSLSSWGYQYELEKALDFIKTKAPDSTAFGSRNIMLGEAGGPANRAAPGERIEKIRQILAQARRWEVPYVTWWEMVGGVGEGQNSLRAPLYDGGAKFTPYYWFYRAYHNRDDPLCIENFEADPFGPAGGDYSEEGYSLNLTGGRRDIEGDVFSCLSSGGSQGKRSLYLRFGSQGGRWSTGLMNLDGRRFSEILLSIRGGAKAAIALTDGKGRTERVFLKQARADWQLLTVSLNKPAGLDLSDLTELAIEASSAGELWVDEIAFAGRGQRPIKQETSGPSIPRAAHILLKSGSQPLSLPGGSGRRLTWLRLIPAKDGFIQNPVLTDGAIAARIAAELRPGQTLEVLPGGTTHLRFGPLGHLLDVSRPEASGLSAHHLTGHPQFHSFQPGGDGSDCRLEWKWQSDFPVRHFRIALYGSLRSGSQAKAQVMISPDGKEWTEAAMDQRTWDETCWIARPPESFIPTPSFWIRFQLLPDQSVPDWPWTIGISDFKIDLWMDSENLDLPSLENLSYRDDSPAKGFRGLLDLDW